MFVAKILGFSKGLGASRKDEKTENKASILKKKGMQCPVDTPSSNKASPYLKYDTPIR